MITTIIFDAEGVVVDTEAIWDQAQVEFLSRRDIVYKREELKSLLTGRSLVEGVHAMQKLYGFPGDPEVLARERLAIVQKLLTNNTHLIDGFLDFFQQIRSRYKVCIATAMRRDLFQKVEFTLNLRSMFGKNIFFIEDVEGKGKPQPDIFLHAATQLQSVVEECLVIEDAPLGVAAAKHAGMKCIALTTTYHREQLLEADAVFDSFAQIMKSGFFETL